MKTPKAQIGDYLKDYGTFQQIIDISENDGDIQYHLDSGLVIGDSDFDESDIMLESEVNEYMNF